MPFELNTCSPAGTLDALGDAIARAKRDDRLAPVTVVVPTNVAGVMARRALGRGRGVLGIDMVTLNRLAELLAGPGLAHAKRQPVSTPLLDLTVRQVLDEAPGAFRSVARHPATVVALRELHQELRLAGDEAGERLRATNRGREATRVSGAVTRMLQRRWYDEADLLAGATEILRSGRPTGLERVVLYLPDPFDALSLAFVRQLAAGGHVTVVVPLTGNAAADHEQRRLIEQLRAQNESDPETEPDPETRPETAVVATPARVVSTTDADDEVRIAVRAVVDAARGADGAAPIRFERMAILWPAQRPYARLVEHHLSADGIAWNGRAGTELSERIAPRLLLDLLDVDRRGLHRRALFELFADVPGRDEDGRIRPTADWERVSRAAGVSRDEDWVPRLTAIARRERWAQSATSLLDFVSALRADLGHPQATRTWAEWVEWCDAQLRKWLGTKAVARFSDPEYRAWEALMSALERLRCLDEVAEPANRATFRTVLDSELGEATVREGRIGTGVTVGSLASAGGLDVDLAVVLGASEGLLPPAPHGDPLLSAADRERGGLAPLDQRTRRLHHQFVAITRSVRTVVTIPRGDLRANAAHQRSRWLAHLDEADIEIVDSATAGLAGLTFPPCERERRLADRLRSIEADDAVLQRNLTMRSARESSAVTEFDGDLSSSTRLPLAEVRNLDPADPAASIGHDAVSPTQIQQWATCPHGYFVTYLLGVRALDDRDQRISIDPSERGNVVHNTLDAFHRDVLDGTLDQPTVAGWTPHHRGALLAHFDIECERFEHAGKTGRPATWARERAALRTELLDWLAHDSDIAVDNGTTVLASERAFPDDADHDERVEVMLAVPGGRQLAVRGKIDRLDRHRDGTLVVTDHKTGSDRDFADLSADDPTLGGTKFQLPTYAAAARSWTGATNDDVVRAEYSMFRKGGYKRIGIEFDADVWHRIEHDLGEVVDGIEAGWFPQRPVRPGYAFYTECLYCDPDELGTADAWSRWTAKRHDARLDRWFGELDTDAHDGTSGFDE